MALYVILANFTDQGVRNIKDTPKRAEAFKEMAVKAGSRSTRSYGRLVSMMSLQLPKPTTTLQRRRRLCRSRLWAILDPKL